MRVADQRPCASRYKPEKDVFLDEIFGLITVERPPRKFEREMALCCKGPIIHFPPELARKVQAKNIAEAIECHADALSTLCPV